MKFLSRFKTGLSAVLLLCLAVPTAAYAANGQGHTITLPQFLILALVMGWYLYNHFKVKIKAFFKKDRDH